jgi:IS30 family transposase
MSTNHSTTKANYKHLSSFERGKIEQLLSDGNTPSQIARILGRHRSTITREIKRGTITQKKKLKKTEVYFEEYFAEAGQRVYKQNRSNCRFLKLEHCSTEFLQELTSALLAKPRCHSVDSFVQTYRKANPLENVPSTKTIYRYIHEGLLKVKSIDLPKAVRLRPRSKATNKNNRRVFGKSIEERSEAINQRTEFGHWEIDLVLGKKTKDEAVILTLLERVSRFTVAVKLPNKQAETINQAIEELMREYPILSITADNGSEFSQLGTIQGLDVYFAHPYSSHERGSNENFNGLLREFVPKGQSLNPLTETELQSYVKAINKRPRRLHQYQSALDLFETAKSA